MIKFKKDYFNIENTLNCGQIFRFFPHKNGYIVQSLDKACFIYYDGDFVIIESLFDDYFYHFFNLDCDYEKAYKKALSFDNEFLTKSANLGKGIRILNQDKLEVFYSFLISQNNNIMRIKRLIESLSSNLGLSFNAFDTELYSIFDFNKLKNCDEDFFKKIGLGYRSKYFVENAKDVTSEELEKLSILKTSDLRIALQKYMGVGPKVADCITLFGYARGDSFPVDTWVKKIYTEDFHGTLTDRNKISNYFVETFGEYSGIIQQYMFFSKRTKD